MFWVQNIRNYFQTRRHKRLVAFFNIPRDARVLDISCGDGDLLAILHKYLVISTAHGIDVSEEGTKRARAKCPWGTFNVASAESLPYKNERFDAILSCMSLHHYVKSQKVFKEISRVLAPMGVAYICDIIPRNRALQMWHNLQKCPEPYHFEKYYTRKDIQSLAHSVGLIVEAARATRWYSNKCVITLKKTIPIAA